MREAVHVHFHPLSDLSEIKSRLISLELKLDRIFKQQGVMMAKVDDLKAELVAANEATNEIASDLDALIARLAGGLSDAEATEVQGQITALKEKLQSVAAKHTPDSPV